MRPRSSDHFGARPPLLNTRQGRIHMRRGTARVSRLSWHPSNGAGRGPRGRRSIGRCVVRTRRCVLRHSRSRTVLGAITVALTLGALVSLLGASAAAGAVGPPFSCQSEVDFLTANTHRRRSDQILRIGIQVGEVVYNEVNSESAASTFNALGYDPNNNYLYATELDFKPTGTPGTLFQIDNTGAATSLGVIKGYPVENAGPTNGAFDPEGNYWITNGNGSQFAYEIDVSKVEGNQDSQTQPSMEADRLLLLRRLHVGPRGNHHLPPRPLHRRSDHLRRSSRGSKRQLRRRVGPSATATSDSPTTPPATSSRSKSKPPSPRPSRCWPITRAPIADAEQRRRGVHRQRNGRPGNREDGTGRRHPGGAVTWTLTVTNHGPGNSSGFSVQDKVPSGFTNVKTTTSGCSVSGNEVSCAEGQLANGGTFTITLTGTAPESAQCLTNEATVTGDEEDPNLANNTSGARPVRKHQSSE